MPDCDIPARARLTTKKPLTRKALLVGIGYHTEIERQGQKWEHIPTPIPHVRAFELFLKESRGYADITVMTDEDGVEERYQPTKSNLKREIKTLGHGVQPGDHRVFYFAGHSDQMPCEMGGEEDGIDKGLVALHGRRIRGNMLKKWLVAGLPKDSSLTAIFDSCHSGTLLDLDHYRCNNVYRPWVNKGDRRSTTSPPPSRLSSTYRKGSDETNVCFHHRIQLVTDTYPKSLSILSTEDSDKHFGQKTAFPKRQSCDGLCRMGPTETTTEHADVISISSSNHGQPSWDAGTSNGGGASMTTYLISILRDHPEITISELMTGLTHKVHFTGDMHNYVQKESRARCKGGRRNADSEPAGEIKGEMNNFQELHLGSVTPLDMGRPFMHIL